MLRRQYVSTLMRTCVNALARDGTKYQYIDVRPCQGINMLVRMDGITYWSTGRGPCTADGDGMDGIVCWTTGTGPLRGQP